MSARGILIRAAGAALLLAGLWCFTPPEPGFRLCGFRWLTGRPCPFCGLTHAVFALAKGHWREAIRFNALSPLAFAMLFAPMPFRQGEQSVGEAAKGTGAARQPAESTEPEPRFGRREVPQDGQQKGRPGGADEDAARRHQSVSAVCGSKPTMSL